MAIIDGINDKDPKYIAESYFKEKFRYCNSEIEKLRKMLSKAVGNKKLIELQKAHYELVVKRGDKQELETWVEENT